MKGKRGDGTKRVAAIASATCVLTLVGVAEALETHPEVQAAWRKGYLKGELSQGFASTGTERKRR